MKEIVSMIQQYIPEFISTVSTLLSAFGGAWFAFRLQNKHEEKSIINNNVSSLNIAQIRLMQQYNEIEKIKKNFTSPILNDPLYWVHIPALSPRDRDIQVDVSSLSILIQADGISVISDILESEEYYKEILKSLNIRSVMHISEFQPYYEKIKNKYDKIDLEILVKELGEKSVIGLMTITDQILAILPDAIKKYKIAMRHLYEKSKEIYPKCKIVMLSEEQ